MSKNNSCLTADTKNNIESNKKKFKKELKDLFQKYGYLSNGNDHEVTFRTTSGNVAWISINSIETIK